MSNNIKTSVIIPIYNTKEYLRQCIDSVVAQSYDKIEIILVDDGSTDGSSEIIKEYANKYSFIKAIFQENQKLGAARNAGARIASGEYIYFLDSDDYIDEKTLSECYKIAKKQDLDFLMFDAVDFSEKDIKNAKEKDGMDYDRSNLDIKDKVYIGVDFWEQFYSKKGVLSCAYLLYINNEFFKNNELYFEENIFYEDNDWIARMYECAQRIAYTPCRFYYRRYRAGSIMMTNYTDTHFYSCIILLKKLVNLFLKSEDIRVQSMFTSIAGSVINRLTAIIKVYLTENRLESMREELFSLIEYIFQFEKMIHEKDENLSKDIFVFINMLSKDIQGNDDSEIEIIDKCKIYIKKYIRQDLQKVHLINENALIGIYGKGMMCKHFLSLYKQYVGEIKAKICFIETAIEENDVYLGYPVYGVKELKDLHLDYVIISSFKYKDEMVENVLKYGTQHIIIQELPNIVRLYNIL